MKNNKVMRAVGIVFSMLVVIVTCMIILSNMGKGYTYDELLSMVPGEYRVAAYGFMSPVLSQQGNYFYFTETPYVMPQDEKVIPVYIEVEDKEVNIEYTNQYIEIVGDLLVVAGEKYTDTNGYMTDRRIINAHMKVVDKPEKEAVQRYNKLAQTGIYEDLYMYYGLIDMLVTDTVDKADIEAINEEEFNNMVLLLAVSGITDTELAKIIDYEAELVKAVNLKINESDYTFIEYKEQVETLEQMLKSYFKGVC